MVTQLKSGIHSSSGTSISSLSKLRHFSHFGLLLSVTVLLFFLLVCGCTTTPAIPGDTGNAGVTILVDDSSALPVVQELGREYMNKTGVPVSVKQVNDNEESGGSHPRGDLLIAGISRMAVYASKEQLVSLNTYLNSSLVANWSVFERPSLTMAGEYPEHSGTIYALPFNQDALGIVYRSDLLEDPNESAAFCVTYGYPLGAPGSYKELTDIAEFFSRNESHLAGIGFAGLTGSDSISSPWLSFVSSYGSGVYDSSSGVAAGTWNSSRTVSALNEMRNISRYEPAGAEKWGDQDVADAISSGIIAMGITWFSQFPGIQNAAQEHNLSLGYLPLPGEITHEGSYRAITVRVDGVGILKDGSRDRAEDFLSWFYSPAVQLSFAESGHQPALLTVLDSYPYLSMNSFNRAFPESMRIGVSSEKGEMAESVRHACEEAVQAIVSPVDTVSPEEMLQILNRSASSIDSIKKTGITSP